MTRGFFSHELTLFKVAAPCRHCSDARYDGKTPCPHTASSAPASGVACPWRLNPPPWTTGARRAGLTREQFVSEQQRPGRPVVFTHLTKDWPALGKFSPEFLRKHCGDRKVPIGNQTYRLSDFRDLLEQ